MKAHTFTPLFPRRVIFPILSRLRAGLFNNCWYICVCILILAPSSALACSDNKLLVFSPSRICESDNEIIFELALESAAAI